MPATILHEVTTENYFDTADGLYWFCVDHHNGQGSTMYRVMCQLEFKPGCAVSGPEGFEAQMVYDDLAALAAVDYNGAEDEAERLLAEIKRNYELAHD